MISMNAWNNLNLFRRNTIYFQSSPVTDSNPVFFPAYVLPCDKIFRETIIHIMDEKNVVISEENKI